MTELNPVDDGLIGQGGKHHPYTKMSYFFAIDRTDEDQNANVQNRVINFVRTYLEANYEELKKLKAQFKEHINTFNPSSLLFVDQLDCLQTLTLPLIHESPEFLSKPITRAQQVKILWIDFALSWFSHNAVDFCPCCNKPFSTYTHPYQVNDILGETFCSYECSENKLLQKVTMQGTLNQVDYPSLVEELGSAFMLKIKANSGDGIVFDHWHDFNDYLFFLNTKHVKHMELAHGWGEAETYGAFKLLNYCYCSNKDLQKSFEIADSGFREYLENRFKTLFWIP